MHVSASPDTPPAAGHPVPADPTPRRPMVMTIVGWVLVGLGALGVAAALGSLSAASGPNTLRLYLFCVSVATGSVGTGVLRTASVWKWSVAVNLQNSHRMDRIEHDLRDLRQAYVRIGTSLEAVGGLITALHETLKQGQSRGYQSLRKDAPYQRPSPADGAAVDGVDRLDAEFRGFLAGQLQRDDPPDV